MERKKSLTKRWPGEWVFRGKIWSPDRESVSTEGNLPEPLGPLMQRLMILGFTSSTSLTPRMKSILEITLRDINTELRIAKET